LKIDNTGNKIHWLKICFLRYQKETPEVIAFKYSYKDDFKFITLNSHRRGRNSTSSQAASNVQECIPVIQRKYDTQLLLSAEKKRNLLQLCQKGIIPSDYHPYFNDLMSSDQIRNRLPSPDIEEEDGYDTA
jgi:hypothetical protein